MELVLNGAAHSNLTDLSLVAETLELREKLGDAPKQLLGKLEGRRGLEVMADYVSAFTEFVLTWKNGSLLGSDRNDIFREALSKDIDELSVA